MEILHLTPNFFPMVGGIETFIYESSKRLLKNGNRVYVITSRGKNKQLSKFEYIDGIKVFRVPFNKIFRYNISLNILRLLLKLDYDIIHIHGIGFLSDLAPILKLTKKRKIFLSTHGGIFHTPYASFLKNIYFHTNGKLSLKFVNKIIAHSLQDKKLFLKICHPKKISLIYYGIDWKNLSNVKRKSNGKTLIYVGRFAKNKRIDRILHVLWYIKKRIQKIKLLMVGGGEEKKKLIQLANKLNIRKNIMFVGSVPHEKIAHYLSIADIFLLSSEFEGFGISVIEAMASGLTVVVNNLPVMKEIIISNKNGYIVNFENPKEVAKLIIKLLNDGNLRKDIKKEAKNSTKKFDWDNINKKLIKVYKGR